MSEEQKLPPVAILAGGLATRLGKLTRSMPKAMIELEGRPFIAHQLEILRQQGIEQVVVCVGHLSNAIQEYVKDGSRFGLQVRYSLDGDRLLGTAGALKKARPLLGEMFYVLYGDSYLSADYTEIRDVFESQNKKGLMTLYKNESQWEPSNVVFRNGFIIRYDKVEWDPEMLYIDYGLSLLRREALDAVPDEEAMDLVEVYKQLIAQGEMLGHPVSERFYEIGTPSGLEALRTMLAQKAKGAGK